jgi:hypothetical protein
MYSLEEYWMDEPSNYFVNRAVSLQLGFIAVWLIDYAAAFIIIIIIAIIVQ